MHLLLFAKEISKITVYNELQDHWTVHFVVGPRDRTSCSCLACNLNCSVEAHKNDRTGHNYEVYVRVQQASGMARI